MISFVEIEKHLASGDLVVLRDASARCTHAGIVLVHGSIERTLLWYVDFVTCQPTVTALEELVAHDGVMRQLLLPDTRAFGELVAGTCMRMFDVCRGVNRAAAAAARVRGAQCCALDPHTLFCASSAFAILTVYFECGLVDVSRVRHGAERRMDEHDLLSDAMNAWLVPTVTLGDAVRFTHAQP